MTYLLDINAVMALMNRDHVDHLRTHRFFARRPFATCPLVLLGVLRLLTRPPHLSGKPPLATPPEAWRKLAVLRNQRATVFVPDEPDPASLRMPFQKVMGHRQWNDFYLVGLAQKHAFMVATFDEGLHQSFPELVKLIP
jgi:uncharacterized protein